jgi:hypothetical protein
MKRIIGIIMIFAISGIGCGGPRYVRGSEMKELDDYAMSTGLDRRDLERLFDENIRSLMASPIVSEWRAQSSPPLVAIFPISNETSEHIDTQLNALLSKVETALINSGAVQIVSRELQDQLIKEVEKQQGGAYNPANVATYGRQLGAKYFITGKIYDSAERTGEERRVQYFLFMQVVNVETAAVRWQNEAQLTKALVE